VIGGGPGIAADSNRVPSALGRDFHPGSSRNR
jgi:hypothetical protein